MAYILLVIRNYIFIQTAIVAFFSPFYLLYALKYRKIGTKKLTISEHLERFFMSREANYLVMTWAALEAIVWFVIPEYLLLLLVFLRIRRKVQLLLYDIYGTILGTLIAFYLPLHSVADIARIPYIQPNMVRQVEVWYTHLGIGGVLFQPFSGVPYKVFTLTAPQFHFWLVPFLLIAVAARVSRYYMFYVGFTSIYPFLHRFVYKNYLPLFFVAGFVFTIALLRVVAIYGAEYVIDYSFIETLKALKIF